MFKKGEKIVYPMYGAGIIESLEVIDANGEQETFYIIRIPNGNLRIKVSQKKAEMIGVRKIYDCKTILEKISKVSDIPVQIQNNWNIRYKENLVKIKSSEIIDVALVARNLMLREKERGLSGAEKKMLNNARQIIISEIILSQDVAKEDAETILSKSLFKG